jgi:L-fuconolactonase
MPGFPIVDAHVHLWDPERYRIPWLDAVPFLKSPYGISDFAAATADLQIDGFVYLEIDIASVYALTEARDLSHLAERDPRVLGIVALAPLEFGEQARPYLQELVAIGSRIKGIRRLTQGEADPDFCLRPGFVRGAQILPEFGLSCDLCCYYVQLGQTVELVRCCPETSFILDHIGKPHIRAGEREPWMSQMRDLASLPNVVCKISGATTEADLANWTIEDVKPYLLHALDVFGEDRVVFGSDWPVVTQAASYRRWVDTVDELTVDWPDAAKRKLWNENARRFYRL